MVLNEDFYDILWILAFKLMFYIFWSEYGKDQEIQVQCMHQDSVREAACRSVWFMWHISYTFISSQSFNLDCRWGTIDIVPTIPFHSSLSSAAPRESPDSIPVPGWLGWAMVLGHPATFAYSRAAGVGGWAIFFIFFIYLPFLMSCLLGDGWTWLKYCGFGY